MVCDKYLIRDVRSPSRHRSSTARGERAETSSLATVGDLPNRAVAVIADQEGTVLCNGDPRRACPDVAVVNHKAGQEILIFSSRLVILQQEADYLVACSPRTVP